jgi:hypothetical protein
LAIYILDVASLTFAVEPLQTYPFVSEETKFEKLTFVAYRFVAVAFVIEALLENTVV